MAENNEPDDRLKLSILRDIRREQRETRDLLVTLTKHVSELGKVLSARIDESDKRTAERIALLNDELSLTIKMEVLGRLANFESHIDQKIEELMR